MSAELRKRLEDEAQKGGRSLNAEIVQRLEWALELAAKPTIVDSSHVQQPVGGALTWLITDEIKRLADRERVSFDEMLAKIILAGLHPSAPQVLYLPVFPGATREDLRTALQATEGFARPDSTVVMDNLWKAPWAPDWMIQVMKVKCPEVIAKVADQKITALDSPSVQEDATPEPKGRPRRIVRKASKT